MDAIAVLQDAFGRIPEVVHAAVDGLASDDLVWRPDPRANTVAWLVWHLSRVQDEHLAEITGREQVWETGEWAPRFGLPADAMDHGYGHTAEQVGQVRPADAATLLAYHDDVAAAVAHDLAGLEPSALERIIDDSFDPPVSIGTRIVSVVDDAAQHAGQVGYLRGLLDRRA